MKKIILIVVAVAAIGTGVWGYNKYRTGDEKAEITKGQVTRGDIVETVGATGTLEAVTTVQVGTQVSGTVDKLYADFNSMVKRGQVLARLDPSLIQTQIEQQRANVIRSEADLERLKVGLEDAKTKFRRAKELADRQLIPRTELEAAEMQVKSQEASIKSSEASLTQARANLNQQQVNLNHTVITAPIDGIVISRNVDEGQTVAASMNAPVLYLLAADLTKMKVSANIDESEVGKIRTGQRVTFRVDAYGNDTFIGTVTQVRLQPVTVQNVVSYVTVIEVPNPDYRLKPGMTANVNIEIARRDNVLRIPAAATRFRPNNDIFAALGQPVPPEMQFGAGRGRGQNAQGGPQGGQQGGTAQPGAQQPNAQQPNAQQNPQRQGGNAPQANANPQNPQRQGGNRQGQSAEQRGGGDNAQRGGGDNAQRGGGDNARQGGGGDRSRFQNMTPEERQKAMEQRMANMTPEERAAFQQRMAQRGQGGGRGQGAGGNFNRGGDNAGRGQGAGNTGRQNGQNRQGGNQATPASPTPATGATIDALFAPLPTVSTRGRVWVTTGDEKAPQLKSIPVRTGITDGQWVELIEGELTQGQEVVTGVILPSARQQVPGQTGGNPLMGPQRGQQPNRGGQPGGGGGNQGRGR